MKRVFFLYKITYFNLKYFFIKYNIVLKGTFSQKKRKKKLTLENENLWKCLVETIKKKLCIKMKKIKIHPSD